MQKIGMQHHMGLSIIPPIYVYRGTMYISILIPMYHVQQV